MSSCRRSSSGSSESLPSSSGGCSSEQKCYRRGKYKFYLRYGVEVVGRAFRTDRRAPRECDPCGGGHLEWLCKRSK